MRKKFVSQEREGDVGRCHAVMHVGFSAAPISRVVKSNISIAGWDVDVFNSLIDFRFPQRDKHSRFLPFGQIILRCVRRRIKG